MPKVIFKKMSLEANINNIKWMYFSGDDNLSFKSSVINYFPDLKDIDSNMSKEEIETKIEELIQECYEYSENKLDEEVKRYNDIWKEYNNNYFEALGRYLNIEWPSDKNEIIASVGLIPIFPRYLDSFSFDLSYGLDKEKVVEVTAHETLHFLWFNKWKRLFPNFKREEFDYPHIIWEYSEMVTDPILNSKEINKVINIEEKAYDYFYELKLNNVSLMEMLKEIYESTKPIEEKMIEGFEVAKKFIKK